MLVSAVALVAELVDPESKQGNPVALELLEPEK